MPIYPDKAGTLVIDMGIGDIAVYRCRPVDSQMENEIAFSVADSTHEIGSEAPVEPGTLTDGCAVRIHFRKPESVQVVIDALVIVKASMEAHQ